MINVVCIKKLNDVNKHNKDVKNIEKERVVFSIGGWVVVFTKDTVTI